MEVHQWGLDKRSSSPSTVIAQENNDMGPNVGSGAERGGLVDFRWEAI